MIGQHEVDCMFPSQDFGEGNWPQYIADREAHPGALDTMVVSDDATAFLHELVADQQPYGAKYDEDRVTRLRDRNDERIAAFQTMLGKLTADQHARQHSRLAAALGFSPAVQAMFEASGENTVTEWLASVEAGVVLSYFKVCVAARETQRRNAWQAARAWPAQHPQLPSVTVPSQPAPLHLAYPESRVA
jgi:hypothetical protein